MVITSVVTEEATALHLLPEKVQFTLPHAEETTGRAVPIAHTGESKVDFGAEIYGIDLNNFTDADFEFISDALHRHKLLVFKEQPEMLKPQQQYKLTSRLVPRFTISPRLADFLPASIRMRRRAASRTARTRSSSTTMASTSSASRSAPPFPRSRRSTSSAAGPFRTATTASPRASRSRG